MANRGDISHIDVRECSEEFKCGPGVAHLSTFQQAQLKRVARLLAVCGKFAVHQVRGVNPLISGRSNAAPEQI